MRLFFLLYGLVAMAAAGAAVVAVLALGLPGWTPIVIAAALGAAVSAPVTWVIARKVATL